MSLLPRSQINEIVIPTRLVSLLSRKSALDTGVREALHDFGAGALTTTPYFFPDYTDHGSTHVSEVLQSADGLIAERSADFLTVEDAAALTLAVLLHDIAMHLSIDGFWSLLNDRHTDAEARQVAVFFGDQSWGELWRAYESEVERLDSDQRHSLFGVREHVTVPKQNSADLRDSQRRIVGEFIRRHHARLAHEIALHGFPAPTGKERLRLSIRLENLKDLIGVVARSHGSPLRPSVDYLQQAYRNRVDPHSVHAPFLMALLRIADFIQIHPERAEKLKLNVKSLRSPASVREWSKHSALASFTFAPDDPEAILAGFNSDLGAQVYFALKEQFASLQQELDQSWAVLGEVYGLHQARGLSNLGLTIRRANTTLDDPAFVAKLSFLPYWARFQAVSSKLLPLLVEPLYGSHPEIGVREMLQNSLDAVRERDALLPRRSRDRTPSPADRRPDIVITLDTVNNQFVVADAGVGMTPKTVLNYFLSVGASSREADEWLRDYVNQRGRSKVLRTGRFGVGVLAIFLLGDKIQVTTRHVREDVGLTFSARLGDDNVEMKPCACKIGTTIKVDISQGTARYLENEEERWDWYQLDAPKVSRELMSESGRRGLQQRNMAPPSAAAAGGNWRRLSKSGYDSAFWTDEAIPFSYNGIRGGFEVEFMKRDQETENSNKWAMGPPFDVKRRFGGKQPSVAIMDREGRLPLTLSRDGLTARDTTFELELTNNILLDYLGFLLATAPERQITLGDAEPLRPVFHSKVLPDFTFFDEWLYGPDGATQLSLLPILDTEFDSIFFVPVMPVSYSAGKHRMSEFAQLPGEDPHPYSEVPLYMPPGIQFDLQRPTLRAYYYTAGLEAHTSTLVECALRFASGRASFANLDFQVRGSRMLINKNFEPGLHDGRLQWRTEWEDGCWALVSQGDCAEEKASYRQIAKIARPKFHGRWPALGIEWHLNRDERRSAQPPDDWPDRGKFFAQPRLFAKAWLKHIGATWVPYRMDDRRQDLTRAFKGLKEEIDIWERRKKAGEITDIWHKLN